MCATCSRRLNTSARSACRCRRNTAARWPVRRQRRDHAADRRPDRRPAARPDADLPAGQLHITSSPETPYLQIGEQVRQTGTGPHRAPGLSLNQGAVWRSVSLDATTRSNITVGPAVRAGDLREGQHHGRLPLPLRRRRQLPSSACATPGTGHPGGVRQPAEIPLGTAGR